ncbi:phytoene desaturase [Candidatus Saccharibacteria bacterium]|nr:phytoene desaturase [Candidatus Saccharibacteria bacterium]NCU40334.1 phytoene desaturase [Candidatus Saccharibacteria bacterium]
MTKKTAIIIGAGYGGMALANLLGKAGYKVDVFEKNASAGGRVSAIESDGYVFDIGPSWYLMPEVFENYYKVFGESSKQRLDLVRLTPGYRVFFENNPSLTIQGDVNNDKKLFESIELGAGKKLQRYVSKSSLAYKVAVEYFLYTNLLSLRDVIAWPVIKNSPQMLMLVAQKLDNYVKLYFKDQRLQQLLEYHMVFLGSSPFQAPAIYTLMSHLDYRSGVFYPKLGMMSLVDDIKLLGSSYDITYHYESPVESILVSHRAAVGVRLSDGSEYHANTVVSNADIQHTETKLLSSDHQSFPQSYWDKRQPGPGALMISLGVKGELPQLLHHNLYFVDAWRENFAAIYENKTIPEKASIYVCNPTKTDRSVAPKGYENLFILMPIPAGLSLSSKQQNELATRVVKEFAKAADIPDLESRIEKQIIVGPDDFKQKFNAWEYNAFGGESHLLSQSIIFRTPNKSKKLKNLYYVGAGTLPGIGLPMCLIGAELTFKKITNNRRPGPLYKDIV